MAPIFFSLKWFSTNFRQGIINYCARHRIELEITLHTTCIFCSTAFAAFFLLYWALLGISWRRKIWRLWMMVWMTSLLNRMSETWWQLDDSWREAFFFSLRYVYANLRKYCCYIFSPIVIGVTVRVHILLLLMLSMMVPALNWGLEVVRGNWI